jgi:ribA/ribD-fused uncharacterized protein
MEAIDMTKTIEPTTSERFTLFFGGPFSQWDESHFIVDSVPYNCAEQYMMAQKARLFRDRQAFADIMRAAHPAEQKRLGKLVRGFDKEQWAMVCRDVVMRGNVAKFTQLPYFRAALLATVGTTLVEASPTDTIWGIGIGEHDPRALVRAEWRGSNWLGQVLTELRLVMEGGAR